MSNNHDTPGPHEVMWDLPDIGAVCCRKGSEAEVNFIYREVFSERSYLQHGITLKPGDSVFDVGANIGLFALFANAECRGSCQLFCFEPIPETYGCLSKTLQAHALADKASTKLLNVGLTHSDSADRAVFMYFPSLPGNSTQYVAQKRQQTQFLRRLLREPKLTFRLIGQMPLASRLCYRFAYALAYPLSPLLARLLDRITTGREVECPLTTLSAVLREYHVEKVDLLKIDVEGAELDVLNGIADADWPRIRQITMEAHTTEGRADRIVALLQSRGFAVARERPKWARLSGVMDNVNIYAHRNSL